MARITRMTKRRLGELLRAEGLLTDDQLRAALEEQRKSNLFLGEALVKLGFVSEEVIAATIVQQFNLPFVSASQFTISADVLNTFPERMYFEYQFIAVDKIGRTLIIVGAGLMNHDVLDELERLSGCKVCQFVSTWKEIKSTIDAHAKDFQKAQPSELSSLGSMLLDDAHSPSAAAPAPVSTAPAAKPSATRSAGSLPAVTAAPAATAQPGFLKAKPPAPPPPPAATPAARPAAASARPAAPLPPPATPLSPRPAALANVKPPAKTSNSNMAAVAAGGKPPETNKPTQPAPGAPAGSGKGLLGLFKKN